MINVGIVGGAGYTAGELARILIHHPQVKLAWMHSNSNAGNSIAQVHTDLAGDTDLVFTNVFDFEGVDAIFLCLEHGKSPSFLQENAVPEHVRIIDLGNDFRIKNDAKHDFVYGLPELNREAIRQSKHIANCGCFATAIQLALLPLAQAQALTHEVHVHAITGSTGAGQSLQASSHFSWRNNNISVYKVFSHQHLAEIRQSLQQLQNSFEHDLNFVPVRGDFTRGIFASIYTETTLSAEELKELYQNYYKDEPFTHVVNQNPHLKQVVNTNKCLVYVEKHGNKAFIISMIDNLVKGASGQAVQNLNILFGLDERLGLNLKASAF